MGMIIQCHGKEGIVLLNNISTDIIGLLYVDLQTCPKTLSFHRLHFLPLCGSKLMFTEELYLFLLFVFCGLVYTTLNITVYTIFSWYCR